MAEAGTILGVSVIGQPGGWSVILKMDRTQKPLGAQKADRPRTWRSLDTLTEYLRKDLHIVHIDAVDGTHYSSAGATRPDAAARMKRAYAAAAPGVWLRAEVHAGLKAAAALGSAACREGGSRYSKLQWCPVPLKQHDH